MHQPAPAANGAPPQPHLNGDAAPAPGAAQNGAQPPGARMSQTDQEIVRLIGQHLLSVGLERSAALVMEESGLHLEHPAAGTFRAHVLAGDWLKADHDLRALHDLLRDSPAVDPHSLAEMKFVVLEQKYLEHLEGGRVLDALHVLRNELTPLAHDTPRVHRLSALMMCADPPELHARARWPGAGPASRRAVLQRVQAVLPPALMMAPGRLRALLAQAAAQQAARCRFHCAPRAPPPPPARASPPASPAAPASPTDHIPFSLLADHHCSADHFPIHSLQVSADGALRRGVVLPVVAGRRAPRLGLQGQHRHAVGLRPRRQAPLLQEVVGGALVRRVVPGVEPRRALPAGRRARGLPRSLDMEHGDGAAAPEDDSLPGGLPDGGGVARRLRQVRVRRRARTVLPLRDRRHADQQLGRRARERAGVPRGRARRAGRRHAPPRAALRLHGPQRPQPDPGGARGDGDDAERGRLAAAAQRGQPGRAPVGHTRARAGAALPRAEPGAFHHPRVLRRRAAGLHRVRQRGQQGVRVAHERRGAGGGDGGAHALRQRRGVEPRAPRRARLRLGRLLAAPVGPTLPPLLGPQPPLHARAALVTKHTATNA